MSDGFKEKRGVQENCQGKWKSQHDDDDGDGDVSQLGSACETHQQAVVQRRGHRGGVCVCGGGISKLEVFRRKTQMISLISKRGYVLLYDG